MITVRRRIGRKNRLLTRAEQSAVLRGVGGVTPLSPVSLLMVSYLRDGISQIHVLEASIAPSLIIPRTRTQPAQEAKCLGGTKLLGEYTQSLLT